jgi:hypothetical protein
MHVWFRAAASLRTRRSTPRDVERRAGTMRMTKKVLIPSVALAFVVGTAFVAAGRSGSDTAAVSQTRRFVRWDLPQFQANYVVMGGEDVSTDAATGDTATLTGSGQAEPFEHEAAGGGTFVHRHADGSIAASGIYRVTGFVRWTPLFGGTLEGTGLVDTIGNGTGAIPDESEEHSGVLVMRVQFVVLKDGEPTGSVNGRLRINCHLPGTTVFVPEGIVVRIPSFDLVFRPTSGNTLFHTLR